MEVKQFEELKFKANYFSGMNSMGGQLYIYSDRLVFKPHAVNMGSLSDKVIPIIDIHGYKKGSLTTMYFILNNGLKIKFAVWEKDAIIQVVEERRQALFQQMGKQMPAPLML